MHLKGWEFTGAAYMTKDERYQPFTPHPEFEFPADAFRAVFPVEVDGLHGPIRCNNATVIPYFCSYRKKRWLFGGYKKKAEMFINVVFQRIMRCDGVELLEVDLELGDDETIEDRFQRFITECYGPDGKCPERSDICRGC